jgi:hypothetical protein
MTFSAPTGVVVGEGRHHFAPSPRTTGDPVDHQQGRSFSCHPVADVVAMDRHMLQIEAHHPLSPCEPGGSTLRIAFLELQSRIAPSNQRTVSRTESSSGRG